LNLDIRQRVAAVGRRVNTLCQGEDGLRHQLTGYHAYDNFGLPHASWRQPLLVPELTHGSGSAKVWRPCTPAMAAGLTDHVWSLQAVLLYRVPPWPQAQTAYNRMPVDDRAGEQLACAPMEGHRVERGVENQWGGLMTG
jgi:hypothetical protein